MSAISRLCNYLYKEAGTRYHLLDIVHISDIITCPIKVFLDRTFGTNITCASLGLMSVGKAFEKLVSNVLVDYEYQRIAKGRIYYTRDGKEEWVELYATPDFVRDGEVLEVKFTTHQVRDVQNQSQAHYETMRSLGLDIPSLTGLHEEIKWLPAYYSWLSQLAGYVYSLNPEAISKASLLVLYQDRMLQYDFEEKYKGKLLDFYSLLYKWLPETILALELAKNYQYINQTIQDWRTGNMILEDLVYTIWSRVIRSYHLLKYYQCQRCIYWRYGICPSIPTIRTPDEEDQARIVHILNWLIRYKLDRMVSAGWQKAIETTIEKLSNVVARQWLRAIRETPRVQVSLEEAMRGRTRPSPEARKKAYLELIQEYTKISPWAGTEEIKIPTKWLMRELNRIGKPVLTPKQIAIIRNHGEVIKGEIFPTPTPEDYRLSKQALIIFIEKLWEIVPEAEIKISNFRIKWEWEGYGEGKGGETS